MSAEERWLVLLLRVFGAVTLCAFFAIFLPTSWMASTHRWLGIGDFPHAPLTEYLTRSIAGLYALHGGFVVLASTDVRRFAPLVTYIAVGDALFGLGLVAIDAIAGLPWYWTAVEGPSVMVASVLILWLQFRMGQASGAWAAVSGVQDSGDRTSPPDLV